MIITLLSPFILILGVIIGIYYRKHLSGCFRLLLAYLILGIITELISKYWGYYSSLKYNLFLIPIYGLMELMLFSILYYKYIIKTKSKVFLYLILILLGLVLVDLSRIGSMFKASSFQSYGKVIADAGIVVFCLIYYLDVVKGRIKPTFELNLLNAASIIFFSLNLIIFLAINFLVNASYGIVMFFWNFNLVIVCLYYIIIIYLIWRNGKTRKSLRLV
jgi:hypothetical protein